MWGIDRKVPSWVKPFIENYIKAKKFETAKKALCENNFSFFYFKYNHIAKPFKGY